MGGLEEKEVGRGERAERLCRWNVMRMGKMEDVGDVGGEGGLHVGNC